MPAGFHPALSSRHPLSEEKRAPPDPCHQTPETALATRPDSPLIHSDRFVSVRSARLSSVSPPPPSIRPIRPAGLFPRHDSVDYIPQKRQGSTGLLDVSGLLLLLL